MSRQPLEDESDPFPSYGDYFCAVRDFLQQKEFKLILAALSQHLRRAVALDELAEIRVVLAKHGEFYHPACIEAVLPALSIPLVLNVAVSDVGRGWFRKEYHLLKRLNAAFPFAYLPKVYGQGCVFAKDAGCEIGLFLGEWFRAYNEFHLARDPADGRLKLLVWDAVHGNFFLEADQSKALYYQAAKILTGYYNPITFEQIDSWHHAAGDFVVKREGSGVDVKLITVREYRPLFVADGGGESLPTDIGTILGALLAFFLNLTIRMRLDRLDGVGEVVWAHNMALEPTLQGILDALALKPRVSQSAAPLDDLFCRYLVTCSRTDLLDLSRAIVQKMNRQAPDIGVVKKHLEQHASDLYDVIQHFDYP